MSFGFFTPVRPKVRKVWDYIYNTGGLYAIAVDSNSNVLCGGESPRTLNKLDKNGKLLWAYTPISTGAVYGVTFDLNGSAYCTASGYLTIVDTDGNYIYRRNMSGTAFAITSDQNYHMFVGTYEGTLWHLDISVAEVWHITPSTPSLSIKIDSDFGVCYSNGDLVSKVDYTDGHTIWDYDTGALTRCIALDSTDNVYYANVNGDVCKLDSSGNLVWSYKSKYGCNSIMVDLENNVYVGCSEGTIIKISSTAKAIWAWKAPKTVYSIAMNPLEPQFIYYADYSGRVTKLIQVL